MSRVSGFLLVLGAATLGVKAVAADPADFQLRLLEMPTNVSDSLEKKLRAGGDESAKAELKLPDLIKRGMIKELEDINFQPQNGIRARVGGPAVDRNGKPVPKATDLEYDVTFGPGGVADFLYSFARHRPGRGKTIQMRRSVNTVVLNPGVLTVLDRWESSGTVQLLVATMRAPGGDDEPAQGGAAASQVWVEAELLRLPSVRSAAAAVKAVETDANRGMERLRIDGKPVARFRKLVRAGQRGRSEDRLEEPRAAWVTGTVIDVECVVGAGGRIDVNASIDYSSDSRNGEGVEGLVGKEIGSGDVCVVQCGKIAGKVDSPFVLAVRATALGATGGQKPKKPLVAAKPPVNRPPGSLYMARYDVPPRFLRTLTDRFKLEFPTAMKALAAAGVPLPKGSIAVFDEEKSQLTVRLAEEGHAAAVRLIKSLPR